MGKSRPGRWSRRGELVTKEVKSGGGSLHELRGLFYFIFIWTRAGLSRHFIFCIAQQTCECE